MVDAPCDYTEEGLKALETKDIIGYLREQRHDFMNHIQVIWGYLQINKSEQAVSYIKEVNRKNESLGRVLKLGNSKAALFFYDLIKKAHIMGFNVDFEVESEDLDGYFTSDSSMKFEVIDEVFHGILKKTECRENHNEIFLDLFAEDDILYIQLSNTSNFDSDIIHCSKGNSSLSDEIIRKACLCNMKIGCGIEGSNILMEISIKRDNNKLP